MNDAIPTPEQFSAWMDEEHFTDRTLAAALHVSRSTVWKWRTQRHPLDWVTWLACQRVAGNATDRRRRQRSLAAVAAADEAASTAVSRTASARVAAEAAAAR